MHDLRQYFLSQRDADYYTPTVVYSIVCNPLPNRQQLLGLRYTYEAIHHYSTSEYTNIVELRLTDTPQQRTPMIYWTILNVWIVFPQTSNPLNSGHPVISCNRHLLQSHSSLHNSEQPCVTASQPHSPLKIGQFQQPWTNSCLGAVSRQTFYQYGLFFVVHYRALSQLATTVGGAWSTTSP